MAALHPLQDALMLLLANDFTRPVQTSFERATGDGGHLEPVREVAIDLRFGPAVASFLFSLRWSHHRRCGRPPPHFGDPIDSAPAVRCVRRSMASRVGA